MNDLERQARHGALLTLARKMRTQQFGKVPHIRSERQDFGGLNRQLLHPAYLNDPLKIERTKEDDLYNK